MIIKNPYNIIAKHYRLINAILLIPMIYLLLHFKDIATFFGDFVAAGYKTHETNFADKYVTTLSFIVLALMVIYHGFLYITFITKKKNGIYYLIATIAYIALILLNLFFHTSMNTITKIDYTFANFIRDMANLAYLPQIALVVITGVRAIGFNFKTFSFEKNYDLQVNEEEEEIEIKLGSDKNVTKKNAVHLIRELKYYVLENKFVFTVIGVVLGVGALLGLLYHFKVTNKVYSHNQAVSSNSFDIALKESYITNVDYKGMEISKGKYYLAVKMRLKNKSYDTTIDKSVFRIVLGDTIFFPLYDRSSRFVDIGKPYEGQLIRSEEENDYVFVYELKENQVKGTYKLRILDDLKEVDGELQKKYKTINVKPINISKKVNLGEVNIGQTVKLKETTLGDSTYRLNKVQIMDHYQYRKKDCDSFRCTEYDQMLVPTLGHVLMALNDEIKLDEKTSYFKNSYKDFYGDFVIIRIKPAPEGEIQRDEVTSTMRDVTPKEVTDLRIYEVPMDALNATKIDMQVRIRNNYFTLHIKS